MPTTLPPTHSLCTYIENQEDQQTIDEMNEVITEDIINQHNQKERGVNLCEKLQELEERSRMLRKLKIKPNTKNYEKYRDANMALNTVILYIHRRLDQINEHEEFINELKEYIMVNGGKSIKRKLMKHKSMKPKSMKRKSMKRKYSKHN